MLRAILPATVMDRSWGVAAHESYFRCVRGLVAFLLAVCLYLLVVFRQWLGLVFFTLRICCIESLIMDKRIETCHVCDGLEFKV